MLVGLFDLVRSIRNRDSAETGDSNVAVSLLMIAIGSAIALFPTFTSETMLRIIGLFAVPVGLYMLIYAGRVRHAIKTLRATV
jgi:uncharacterized membrane protein HdeD (DUF308 family)